MKECSGLADSMQSWNGSDLSSDDARQPELEGSPSNKENNAANVQETCLEPSQPHTPPLTKPAVLLTEMTGAESAAARRSPPSDASPGSGGAAAAQMGSRSSVSMGEGLKDRLVARDDASRALAQYPSPLLTSAPSQRAPRRPRTSMASPASSSLDASPHRSDSEPLQLLHDAPGEAVSPEARRSSPLDDVRRKRPHSQHMQDYLSRMERLLAEVQAVHGKAAKPKPKFAAVGAALGCSLSSSLRSSQKRESWSSSAGAEEAAEQEGAGSERNKVPQSQGGDRVPSHALTQPNDGAQEGGGATVSACAPPSPSSPLPLPSAPNTWLDADVWASPDPEEAGHPTRSETPPQHLRRRRLNGVPVKSSRGSDEAPLADIEEEECAPLSPSRGSMPEVGSPLEARSDRWLHRLQAWGVVPEGAARTQGENTTIHTGEDHPEARHAGGLPSGDVGRSARREGCYDEDGARSNSGGDDRADGAVEIPGCKSRRTCVGADLEEKGGQRGGHLGDEEEKGGQRDGHLGDGEASCCGVVVDARGDGVAGRSDPPRHNREEACEAASCPPQGDARLGPDPSSSSDRRASHSGLRSSPARSSVCWSPPLAASPPLPAAWSRPDSEAACLLQQQLRRAALEDQRAEYGEGGGRGEEQGARLARGLHSEFHAPAADNASRVDACPAGAVNNLHLMSRARPARAAASSSSPASSSSSPQRHQQRALAQGVGAGVGDGSAAVTPTPERGQEDGDGEAMCSPVDSSLLAWTPPQNNVRSRLGRASSSRDSGDESPDLASPLMEGSSAGDDAPPTPPHVGARASRSRTHAAASPPSPEQPSTPRSDSAGGSPPTSRSLLAELSSSPVTGSRLPVKRMTAQRSDSSCDSGDGKASSVPNNSPPPSGQPGGSNKDDADEMKDSGAAQPAPAAFEAASECARAHPSSPAESDPLQGTFSAWTERASHDWEATNTTVPGPSKDSSSSEAGGRVAAECAKTPGVGAMAEREPQSEPQRSEPPPPSGAPSQEVTLPEPGLSPSQGEQPGLGRELSNATLRRGCMVDASTSPMDLKQVFTRGGGGKEEAEELRGPTVADSAQFTTRMTQREPASTCVSQPQMPKSLRASVKNIKEVAARRRRQQATSKSTYQEPSEVSSQMRISQLDEGAGAGFRGPTSHVAASAAAALNREERGMAQGVVYHRMCWEFSQGIRSNPPPSPAGFAAACASIRAHVKGWMVRRRWRSKRGAALAQELADLVTMRLQMAHEAQPGGGAGADPLRNPALLQDAFFLQLTAQTAQRRAQLLVLLNDPAHPGPPARRAFKGASSLRGPGGSARGIGWGGGGGGAESSRAVSAATAKRRAALEGGGCAASGGEPRRQRREPAQATAQSQPALRPRRQPDVHVSAPWGDEARDVAVPADPPESEEPHQGAERALHRPFLKRKSQSFAIGRKSNFASVKPRVDCKLRVRDGASRQHPAKPKSAGDARGGAAASPHNPRRSSGSRGSYKQQLKMVKSRVYGHLQSPPRATSPPSASPNKPPSHRSSPHSALKQQHMRSPRPAAAAPSPASSSHYAPQGHLGTGAEEHQECLSRSAAALEALYAAAMSGGQYLHSVDLFPSGGRAQRSSLVPRLDPADPRLSEMAQKRSVSTLYEALQQRLHSQPGRLSFGRIWAE